MLCKEHKIMSIDEEKRERIINASLREFSKGYQEAKTDAIVKEAGISKGLLFHYFGTKDGVFRFLCDYVHELLAEEFFSSVDNDIPDILERIRQIVLLRAEMCIRYPNLFHFVSKVYLSEDGMFQKICNNEFQMRIQKKFDEMLSGYDKTLFKADIDPEKAVKMVLWTLQGYADAVMKSGLDGEEPEALHKRFQQDITAYFSMFRSMMYR